ncbi:SDR family NAD(P)-dependent oxidoreductase [Sediminispirochaeta bajacaliforniensis]|uniref:SDR family NAD(P)-dependent oxidoreductase n=1 Tax=Sediminispirochaeta bajacaliforniensis TaxID=148 RepID=UPI000371ECB1|nr:SDR family oxidoreductase [Sediminispirochaeta bajacaliforniensis]
MQIKDSVILITGGAIRVGRAFALYFAEQGANIAFSYLSPEENPEETKKEIEALGVGALSVRTDVSDLHQIERLVTETMDRFGRIDTLINGAGIWLKSPFLEISEKEWDLSISVNLKGPFFCSQAVAPIMRKQKGGVIVNITDLSAFQVWDSYSHHAASKAGLVSVTKYLAAELAPYIRVNAIAPGTILLPPGASEEKITWSREKSLLKRIGTPEEAAMLIRLIIENDFITGGIYPVDGGRSLV